MQRRKPWWKQPPRPPAPQAGVCAVCEQQKRPPRGDVAARLQSWLAISHDGENELAGGDWVFRATPTLRLQRDVLTPELAAWDVLRFPGEAWEEPSVYCAAPGWVCEIVSTDNASLLRRRKMPIYARERVRHVWVIDVRDRTVEALALGDRVYELVGAFTGVESLFSLPPFPRAFLAQELFWKSAGGAGPK